MTQTREKRYFHVLSRPGFCMKISWYTVCSFLFFCLEPTLGKDAWMRATSTNVMVIFSKMPFWKLLGHNYIQSSFSTISRCIDNSILKDTLQLKILRTWIKICANLFIKAWVNIIKRKSTKVPWKLSLAKKKKKKKNTTPQFKEFCTKVDDISLFTCFFFSERNLVFKSHPVFINILDSFSHSLFISLPFDYWCSTEFEFHPVPLRLL